MMLRKAKILVNKIIVEYLIPHSLHLSLSLTGLEKYLVTHNIPAPTLQYTIK